MNLYKQRDLENLEPHYGKHVSAITGEKLHGKSDIAAELAWRDQRIAELEKEIDRELLEDEPSCYHPEDIFGDPDEFFPGNDDEFYSKNDLHPRGKSDE